MPKIMLFQAEARAALGRGVEKLTKTVQGTLGPKGGNTIIDTPLGRLDSSHRRHLVERYFPFASHQVILLSTDEEIVGPYHKALAPFVARHYRLAA